MKKQTNVERFYEWMLSINNKFLHDQQRMARAFHIVAMRDVNDIEVVDYEIIKSN